MRFVASFFVLFLFNGISQAQQREAAIMGAGMNTCAEFAEQYRRNPADIGLLYFSWAQGFMSALNGSQVLLNRSMRNLKAVPILDQIKFLQSACDKRPLATFSEIVQDYFYSLPALSQKSN